VFIASAIATRLTGGDERLTSSAIATAGRAGAVHDGP